MYIYYSRGTTLNNFCKIDFTCNSFVYLQICIVCIMFIVSFPFVCALGVVFQLNFVHHKFK